jgi:ATP-dependent HslUV protease ATP-binding subunit HslU
MQLPIEELTPRQIVAELDRYIVGQDAAKRAVAVALRNRYRRQRLPHEERDDILPKNILMIGPTGVGKTEIARRLAQLARAPFIKVEATKFTEVGYVGRDVDSMVRDLAAAAVRMVERERIEAAQPEAAERAYDRAAEILDHAREARRPPQSAFVSPLFGGAEDLDAPGGGWEAEEQARRERVARLRDEIVAGRHLDEQVTVEIEERQNPFLQVFTPQGMEEMGLDMANLMQGRAQRGTRRVTVREALEILREDEARSTIDQTGLAREAIHRAEQTGIIFLDEIDKIAAKGGGAGPEVSREGVQRDLLPVIEGSTVATKYGPVRTDHVLFIAAGAFHMSKPSELIPELQGRLPIRVVLGALGESDFRRILREPKNALLRQYQLLLEVDGVRLEVTEAGLDELAHLAVVVNEKAGNIGARRLHTLFERLLEPELFAAPDARLTEVRIDAEDVRQRLGKLVDDATMNWKMI